MQQGYLLSYIRVKYLSRISHHLNINLNINLNDEKYEVNKYFTLTITIILHVYCINYFATI